MSCPDANKILAFADGALPESERSAVAVHLDACELCVALVAAVARPSLVGEPSKPANERRLAAGTAIGRYMLLELVGSGGMGDVYAAYDPKLGRRVALKLMSERVASPTAVARFTREAQAVARLSHPNVVAIYDAGEFVDRAYLAMEFVEGQTVADWLAEEPRSWREIRQVFVAAGTGLAAAHEAGLVHRDFKPQNVMVGRDGSVRVMDFGLAADASEVAPGDSVLDANRSGLELSTHTLALTRSGVLLGTPLYMAPEQFLKRKASARTDQFSFCVALHEALYGERPFPSESLSRLVEAVTAGRMRKPTQRTRTPLFLRKILLRGLAAEPASRFPSMLALLHALRNDPVRRRRNITVGTTVAVTALAIAVGVGRTQRSTAALCRSGPSLLADSWTGEPPPRNPRRRVLQAAYLATGLPTAMEAWDRVAALLDRYAGGWLKMYRDSCEATHVRGEQSAEVLDLRMACLEGHHAALKALTDAFVSADRETVSKGVDAVNALPTLDRCADVPLLRAVVEPPRNPGTRARVDDLRRRAAVAKALYDTGRDQQAVAEGRELVAEARAVGYVPLLAELLAMVGSFQQGPLFRADSVKTLEEAIWTGIRARRDDIAAEAASLLAGMVGYLQHRPEDGERWADLADALLDRMGEGHDILRAWVLNDRAAMVIVSDPAASLRFAERSLALKRKVLPLDHPDIASTLETIAESYHRLGDDAHALDVIRQAQESYSRAYGPSSAFVAQSLSNQGEYLVALGRPAEALPMFQDALRRWESELSPDHPFLGYPLTGLGRALLALGRPNEARSFLERALHIRDAHEPDPEQRAETRFALAKARWAVGDRAHSVTLAEQSRKEYVAASKPTSVAQVEGWLRERELNPQSSLP